MADTTLNKLFPVEISFYIQKKLFKLRFNRVITELKQIINDLGIEVEPSDFILSSYMWYEFWIDFTDLPKHPKRNFVVLLYPRLNLSNYNNEDPFGVVSRKWLS